MKITSTYSYELEDGFIIDATRQGNLASFINHSCDPNCKALPWNHKGNDRLFIFALKDIQPRTELTYDYKLCYNQSKDTIKCLCKS